LTPTTQRVDLYQLHRIDPKVPLAEQLGELVLLQQEGKIRHIGLSEVSVAEIEQARGLADIVSVQNLCNLANRQAEDHRGSLTSWPCSSRAATCWRTRALASRTLLVTASASSGVGLAPYFGMVLPAAVLLGMTSAVAQLLVAFVAHLEGLEIISPATGMVAWEAQRDRAENTVVRTAPTAASTPPLSIARPAARTALASCCGAWWREQAAGEAADRRRADRQRDGAEWPAIEVLSTSGS
jgi:hypothetical protein